MHELIKWCGKNILDEYSYSYALEPKKTLDSILNDYRDFNICESRVYDYYNENEKYRDTADSDGVPSFVKIYANVGSSGDAVPFVKLQGYLNDLVMKMSQY